MKKVLLFVFVSTFMLCVQQLNAQLYNYTMDPNGYSAYTNPNLFSERLRRGHGAKGAGDACPIGFSTKNFTVDGMAATTNPCIILKIVPEPFVTAHITAIHADYRITNNGPIYVRQSYSLDSGVTWVDSGFDITPVIDDCGGDVINGAWDMPDFSSSQLILIRIEGYGALDSTGRLNITNFVVNGYLDLIDLDGDGYGTYIDCNDSNPTIHPGATELCNDIDEDCDGIVAEVSTTIWPAGILNLCKNDFITLHTTAGYDAYQWLKNGYIMPGKTDSTVITDKPGYYQVIVTGGECTDTSEVQAVAVIENPFANIYAPEGTDLCVDDSLKLKVSYADGYTWQWYKDGAIILYATTYKILATEPGAYYCEIATFYGCGRTTDSIIVTHSCRLAEAISSGLQVFPNPANTHISMNINMQSTLSGTAILNIINVNGQVMLTRELSVNNGSLNYNLDTSALPSGMFMAHIFFNSQTYNAQFTISK